MDFDDPRIEPFIDHYMLSGNGSAAARHVGVADGTAHSAAYRWLTRQDVQDEIERKSAEYRAQHRMTIGKIEGMIRELAEVEVLDIFDEEGKLRRFQDMPLRARRAIKAVKRKEFEDQFGFVYRIDIDVEMHDKKDALRMLGQYRKMFTDKIDLSGDLTQKVSITINGIKK